MLLTNAAYLACVLGAEFSQDLPQQFLTLLQGLGSFAHKVVGDGNLHIILKTSETVTQHKISI